MKNWKFLSLFIVVFTSGILSSCTDEDDNQVITTVDPSPVINTVNNGTWFVSLYNDSGTIETSNFSGYSFVFGPNNVLTATSTSTSVSGSWSVTSDTSLDDSTNYDLDFNLSFVAPANFSDLSEDWNIISYTSTKIELIHVSGGNVGTDYLTFEKN